MGFRVEELSRRADVSVDTIRFYQKRQLLPPPEREGRIDLDENGVIDGPDPRPATPGFLIGDPAPSRR
jgi:hypothetical protein